MAEELWTRIDRYIAEQFSLDDPALTAALEATSAAGLPEIQVSAAQGKLLHVLALSVQARAILEMGTLAGYSGIWLARALPPGGRLITLELDPRHAEVARRNFKYTGVADRVEVRVGRALDLLPAISKEGVAPFDLIFIDADKASYPQYLEWSLKLSRPGTLIIADNVVRRLAMDDPTGQDENTTGIRRFNEMLAHEKRVSATVIQTVGAKGHDGLAIATVLG
jgi:predicted O-methyltransferase YrrM